MLLGCRGRPPPRPRTRSRPRSIWQRASQTLFFEHEDEKLATGHFRHLPLTGSHYRRG
jgi:hypothetical protein